MKVIEVLFGSDKNLVIFAVVAITIYALYMLGASGKEIAGNALSGLFGIAVGQKLAG
jgi:hypothetical protein